MGYVCSNDGLDFATKRELIEHIQEKYGCTFLEGDFSDLAEKLASKKGQGGSAKHAALAEKHKFARGD